MGAQKIELKILLTVVMSFIGWGAAWESLPLVCDKSDSTVSSLSVTEHNHGNGKKRFLKLSLTCEKDGSQQQVASSSRFFLEYPGKYFLEVALLK